MNDIVTRCNPSKLISEAVDIYNNLCVSCDDAAIGICLNEFDEKAEAVTVVMCGLGVHNINLIYFDIKNHKASFYSDNSIENERACHIMLGVYLWVASFSKTNLKMVFTKKMDVDEFTAVLQTALKDTEGLGKMEFVSPTTGKVNRISKLFLSTEMLVPDEIVIDKNQMFKKIFNNIGDEVYQKSSTAIAIEETYKTAMPKTLVQQDRIYTTDESKLILPLQPWYIMPKEVTEMAKLIQMTKNSIAPMRNFMLRGDAGTGKTEAVRALSALLNKPYVEYTCSADTEIFDFYGQAIPDNDGKIVYSETPFIKAVRNGYLIEIQEPSVILKEGVLVGLNGLLDQTNRLTLPTGEIIIRHPDCVIVFTTNSSYVGCNDMNQSVISRCDAVYDFAAPSRSEVVKRVANLVGRSDINEVIGKMVAISSKIKGFLNDNGIGDGVCGIREVIGWVNIYCITGDILASARCTIVSKSTSDVSIHADIFALVKAAFS